MFLNDIISKLEAKLEKEQIQQFESGAKSSENKPPYECLTFSLLKRAADRMRLGMHYGKHNWKKGITDKAFIVDRLNHAFEHLKKAQDLIESDCDYSDDDLAAVVVNCMMAMEYQDWFKTTSREFEKQISERSPNNDIVVARGGSDMMQDPTSRYDSNSSSSKASQ